MRAHATPSLQARAGLSAGSKGALGDLWMAGFTFLLLGATIGIGVWRLVTDGIVRSTWNFG